MKVVVVGATGNLGTSVLRALAATPEVTEVVGLARRLPGFTLPKARFVRCDVTTDMLVPHFQGAAAVIHLAWLLQPRRDAKRLERTNVDGSCRVFEAVVEAGAPALLYASSVGAYGPGPKDREVDESWNTAGIATSLYSVQKAKVERVLDRLERAHRALRVVRMRPALVFKRGAATEIRRLFVGPFVPRFVYGKGRIPFVPDVDRLRFQCVHSHDVGRAFALATVGDAHGPFNLAAEPVLDAHSLASALGARPLRLPSAWLRRAVEAAWRLRLTPSDAGWFDLATQTPLMDSTRARRELGWQPEHRSTDALIELVDGMRERAGLETVPLTSARGAGEELT